MFRRTYFGLAAIVTLACISCDKVPLLAPTNSTVTIDAGSRVVPAGGTTEVTATVIESGGTPVQNGTLVRFTTTLGRVDPVEAQTRNGLAVTTFMAGNDSGIAEVKATSGGAGGGSTTPPATGTTPPATTTTTNSNIVLIAVGSGAVDTVTVRANPASVSTNGGTVTLTATVVGVGGRTLPGITVSFTATRGTLSSTTAVTDSAGEARVTLTTNGDTDVTVAAGTKTATAKITGQPGPAVTLTCSVGTVTNCAVVSVNQPVLFTAQKATSSSVIAAATLDFGDGTSADLGALASAVNVSHSYSQTGTYTARLTARDINGEIVTTPQIVQVLDQATVTVSLQITSGRTVLATATVNGGTGTQYAWTFETGATFTTASNSQSFPYTTAGTKTVNVTVTLSDGRTTVGGASINVP